MYNWYKINLDSRGVMIGTVHASDHWHKFRSRHTKNARVRSTFFDALLNQSQTDGTTDSGGGSRAVARRAIGGGIPKWT